MGVVWFALGVVLGYAVAAVMSSSECSACRERKKTGGDDRA